VRDEDSVLGAVAQTVEKFGGIDICVNNASAINLVGTENLEMKRYDLMQDINTRGTFLFSKACLPHLREAENPHVLTLSPPIDQITKAEWFKDFPAYAIAKFGMSLCTLGMAEEFKEAGIAFNSLWPRTIIATAAIENVAGGPEAMKKARRPDIMADAAYEVFTRPSRECTGNFFIDDELVTGDVGRYRVDPSGSEADLVPDFFV
jgi:citronellol/citronellal dehydrogenase